MIVPSVVNHSILNIVLKHGTKTVAPVRTSFSRRCGFPSLILSEKHLESWMPILWETSWCLSTLDRLFRWVVDFAQACGVHWDSPHSPSIGICTTGLWGVDHGKTVMGNSNKGTMMVNVSWVMRESWEPWLLCLHCCKKCQEVLFTMCISDQITMAERWMVRFAIRSSTFHDIWFSPANWISSIQSPLTRPLNNCRSAPSDATKEITRPGT